MQILFRIISAALTIYMILLLIRVLMTWFRGVSLGRASEILASLTDPYLNYFRRFRFLRLGSIDFSPVMGFVVLGFFLDIFNHLARYGSISLGIILAIITGSLWNIVSFLLVFLIILTIIRLLSFMSPAMAAAGINQFIEPIVSPLTDWFRRRILRNRFMPIKRQVGFLLLLLFVAFIGGRIVINILIALFLKIPF